MQTFHGKIITCDAENSVAEYLVEDGGMIVFVGNDLPQRYAKAGNRIELGERALMPSFGDGHLHFSNWTFVSLMLRDVREARNFKELGDMIRDFSDRKRKLKILALYGFSRHSIEEKRLITRQELDEIIIDRPLYIFCYEGHSAVFNSKMLDMFPEELKSSRGFNTDTGHVSHEAYFKTTDFITNSFSVQQLMGSIIRGYDLLANKGIGMIHPVEGIGFPGDLDVGMVRLVAKARAKRNRFNTRLFFQTMDLEKVEKKKLPRVGGCFATALDGCFGVCNAALNSPYEHDPGNRGVLYYSDDVITSFTRQANRAGLQMEFHVIGDAAVDQAIKALEGALNDHPRKDHRHTLIHACLISDENLEKCARLGIGITLQPAFLASSLEPPNYLEEILGDRVRSSSPLRKMLDLGIHVSGGSDAPVTPPDPIEGIYASCNHPYDPAQSVTVQEALKMFTHEVAWTGFDDGERGGLEENKVADMVILNRDPLAMNAKDLRSLEVMGLYLSGRKYKPGMGIPGMLWNGLTAGGVKV
jgi:predicted amidohydrolase YtcJ